MGFLKDLRTIQRQAEEIQRTAPDPSAQFAAMAAQMEAVSAGMAQSAALLDPDAADVTVGEVHLTTVGHAAGMLNGAPLVTVSALVTLPGRPPVPATANVPVPVTFTHLLQVGATLPARVRTTDPSAFVIDWPAAAAR